MNVTKYGEVYVVEEEHNGKKLVCSYLGDDFSPKCRQSAMLVDFPYDLQLWYLKASLSFRLFLPKLKRVLVVGLGSGSLTKWLYHNTKAEIVSVDINPDMIAAAKNSFFVPEDARSKIICEDASVLVNKFADSYFDLVYLDGYGGSSGGDISIIPCLNTPEFYASTRAITNATGATLINILIQKKAVYGLIKRVYEGHTYLISQMYQGNQIVLAFKKERSWDKHVVGRKAVEFNNTDSSVNYPLFLKAIIRNGGKSTNLSYIV